MSQSSPQAVVERALKLSRADDCVVLVREHSSANLRWAGNSVTTNGVTAGRTVTVAALSHGSAGTSVGVVRRTGLLDDELADLVRAAEAAAEDAVPSEDARPLVAPESAGRGADWDGEPAGTGVEVFSDLAPALGRAFTAANAAGRLLYGYAQHTSVTTFLGSSTGVRLRVDEPNGTVELNAKSAPPSRGGGHSTWLGRVTRDFADVDAEDFGEELARRTEWARRRVDLPAGRYETLLPPTAVADLMVPMYQDAGGRDAAEGRTAFSAGDGGTRVGERLASLPLNLFSDPHRPGLECAPFVVADAPGREVTVFDNGLPLRRTDWISGGELAALGQTRHSAELTGLPLTPFVDNLVLELPGASASLEEMVAETERGLLLTCLWYIRPVDPQTMLLTGLTRDGVYLVENGRVTGAVNNFRFNESPISVLGRATQAGATVPGLSREAADDFPRTAMPPLRIPDFNMSTVSQAS